MLCERELCTGCMACLNVCNNNAIKVVVDKEGFNRPEIDDTKCIKCNRCNRACPIMNEIKKEVGSQAVFACWTKDKKLRRGSTSGGIFSELSKMILHKKGVVIGAALNSTFDVEHICVSNEEDLYKLRGSKYVQSNIGSIYAQTKRYLDKGVPVLFSGTPCQVAGLYGYLGQVKYDDLYTCDIVCHGVPSPMIFKKYVSFLKDKYGSNVANMSFRDKRNGWTYFNMKVDFCNGDTYIGNYFKDPYIVGFLKDIFLRPSCYRCQFANLTRMGDITIADFWGYKSTGAKDKNNDKGISLVILNNHKGQKTFEECKGNLVAFERSMSEAMKGNKCLSESYPIPKERGDFWKDYANLGFDSIVQKYMTIRKKSFSQYILSNFDYKIAKYMLLPVRAINKLKKLSVKNKSI